MLRHGLAHVRLTLARAPVRPAWPSACHAPALARAHSTPAGPPTPIPRHRVVIVGAGFGGMTTINALRGAPVDITLIDRSNCHLFQPLLYQVGTCDLGTSDIAWPIRHLVASRPEITTLLGEVDSVDKNARLVHIKDDADPIPYDTLVLATGARDAFFGHDEWGHIAPGLKTLRDATTVRRRLLVGFELAERVADPELRKSLMTFTIIGGGPTGVELAGAIAQMAHRTLPHEFRKIDTRDARIVLIEAGTRVLSSFPEDLSAYAKRALEDLGVEVKLNQPVSDLQVDRVVAGNETIPCSTIFWAAGVQASVAHRWISAPTDKAGRIQVEPDLSVPHHPEIFAIGDTAAVHNADGSPVPGIAPAAKQMGKYVGKLVRSRIHGEPAPAPFRYVDMGSLATIGKNKAVISYKGFKLRGWIAWWMWGLAHIYFLISVRSRLSVALNWLWNFTRNFRASRVITQDPFQDFPKGFPESVSKHRHRENP